MVEELTNVSNYTKTDRNSAGAWLTHSTGQQPPPSELSQNIRQRKDWPARDSRVSQQDAVLVGGQSKEGRVHRESELHKGSEGGEDRNEVLTVSNVVVKWQEISAISFIHDTFAILREII